MEEMRVAEVVEFVRVDRRECAVNLVDGDPEDEREDENVEENSDFGDDAVFEEKSRAEDGDAVFKGEEAENLRDGLAARADKEEPHPHRRERDGDRQFTRDPFMNVQGFRERETGGGDREGDELREMKADEWLQLECRLRLFRGVEEKRGERETLHREVDGGERPDAQLRRAVVRPVPKENREDRDEPALKGDEADRLTEASCPGEDDVA